MKRSLVTLALVAIAAFGLADGWCFVVSGDGRTDDKNPDPTGINTPVATKLFEAMAAEHPRFLLWTGDLVHGVYGKVTMPLDQQLTAWIQMSRGFGAPILPVRGNHETYGDKDGAIWQRLVRPMMDAVKVEYFKGEEGYSYLYRPTFDRKVAVVGLDQYVNAHRVNLAGLEGALKKVKKNGVKNIFVMAHEMAFTCTSHGDDDNLSKYRADRDKFIELLQRYGVRYFFAGHDHVYDWMTIRRPGWPKGYVLNQIVAGTAGAPSYTDKGYFGNHGRYTLTRKEHKDNTFGYMLVQVNDRDNLTVTFKPVSAP